MKLIDYMRAYDLDDDAMAKLVGGITSHGIRKLKYQERDPSIGVAVRIERITNGLVRPADLIKSVNGPPRTPLAHPSPDRRIG